MLLHFPHDASWLPLFTRPRFGGFERLRDGHRLAVLAVRRTRQQIQDEKEAEDDENVTVEEIEYRYPGPKPHTKEAAILMLSDCVESAARAMTERKPSQIEQLVRDLALKRLMDGQFDECNLTFNELAQIQAAIVSRVNAIYHGRVSYPDEDEQPEPVASTA